MSSSSENAPGPAILWFRRDLRLADHPALAAAAADAGDAGVLAVFVVDPALTSGAGAARLECLRRALRNLDAELGGKLLLVRGAPREQIPRLARHLGARRVHITGEPTPAGRRRDSDVNKRLAENGAELVATGTPYAVSPGRVLTGDRAPFKVFTPFRRAWYEHGWPAPADTGPGTAKWLDPATVPGGVPLGEALGGTAPDGVDIPDVGERAAREAWSSFYDSGLAAYSRERDRPDLDSTSRMSVHLKFGTIHPRTMLADLATLGASDGLDQDLSAGRDAFASELAWREFYADVLYNRPDTAHGNVYRVWDDYPWAQGAEADADFEAWASGRTGYPIVDAGMRQLRAQGWMHNRLRMVTASFLTKDLHIDWRRGAQHFMDLLIDGDIASNQHGWQWTAGTGTDASPFFRIFNPITQGKRFDPDGDYVRRWIPELRDIAGPAVHGPFPDGVGDYPPPLVDHQDQRQIALAQYAEHIKGR